MANIMGELTLSGVDTAGALRRFSGNEALYQKYTLTFPTDPSYGAFKTAFDAGDFESAQRHIHDLKGTSGTLGFTRMFELSSEILGLLRSGQYQETRGPAMELAAEYENMTTVLRGLTPAR